MNQSDKNRIRIFHTNLSKLFVISPWRMHSYFRSLFTKSIPLLNFSNHFLLCIFLWKFIIVYMCKTFNNYWIFLTKFIKCNRFSFLKRSSKIYTRSNTSCCWYFKSILDNWIRILFFCSMIKDSTFRTISTKMIRIIIFTNLTKSFLSV